MPVAVITGGSRGFGRALALDLGRDGWSLVIDGRDPGPLQEVGGLLADRGAPVAVVPGDVGDADHRRALVEAAHGLGSLDLLVNNASTLGPTPLPRLGDYPLAELRHVYEVNVIAPLALVQEALPALRRARGTVVALTSDAAVEDYEAWGGYGSSKAALEQVHRILAAEEGLADHNTLDKIREARGTLILAMQSYSSALPALKGRRDLAETIFTNLNNHVIGAIRDETGREMAANIFGKEWQTEKSHSYGSKDSAVTVKRELRHVFHTGIFTRLPQFKCIVFHVAGRWAQGYLPPLTDDGKRVSRRHRLTPFKRIVS